MENKKKITVSSILNMLEKGKTRDVIAEELDLTKSEIKQIFQHPKLKGKRATKEVNFILEDDTEIINENVVLDTVQNDNSINTVELQDNLKDLKTI